MFISPLNQTDLLSRLDYLETKTMKRKSADELFEQQPPEKKQYFLEAITTTTTLEEEATQSDYHQKLKAYKRIWEALDTNNPLDAQLEPFLWSKIRALSSALSSSASASSSSSLNSS